MVNDSGFFNVAGDRLLHLGMTAAANGVAVKLHIREIAKQIPNIQQRAQLYATFVISSSFNSSDGHECWVIAFLKAA